MTTMTVKNAAGTDETVEKPLAPGRAAAAASKPVALSTEDLAKLDAILTKLSGDPATQTTMAAVLAKLIAAPATEAKQDAANTALGTLATQTTLAAVLAKLTSDPATQTTLAAILAKLIAAPATEAKQDIGNTALGTLATQTTAAAILAKLTADPATQTTLAAILAKMIAAPATEAKQDTANTALSAIGSLLTTQSAFLDGIEALLAAATPAGENFVGKVGGVSAVATATIVRPADTNAYASGDLVAASTTAATVNGAPTGVAAARVNGGTGVIRRVRLSTTKTGLAGSDVFRIHLFKTAPTVTNGDNGALAVNGVAAGALGFVDVTLSSVFNDGAKGYAACDIVFDTPGGAATLFALIEARGAYTPASAETFGLAFEILRD